MVEGFEKYLKNVKGYSQKTVDSYISSVKQFDKIMKDFDIDDIKLNDLNTVYVAGLANLNLSTSSICCKISAVKTYFKYLNSNGFTKNNAAADMVLPKKAQKAVRIMEKSDREKFFESIKRNEYMNYFRDLTMFTLMFNTAIRREELTNLKLCDVSLENNTLLVHGKGNKERIVYFNDAVKALLSEYTVSHRKLYKNAGESEFLFLGKNSKKLNLATINTTFNMYIKAADLENKGFTVHTARKTCATEMYRRCGDIYAVKEVLGHTSLATTQRYVKIGEEQKKKAAMAINL